MRRIVDINKIQDTTTLMIDKTKLIEETMKELEINIKEISNCYRGIDVDIIKSKYLEDLKKINAITSTLDSYIKYFKWLKTAYGENLNTSIKDFSELSNQFELKEKNNFSEFDNLVNQTLQIPGLKGN